MAYDPKTYLQQALKTGFQDIYSPASNIDDSPRYEGSEARFGDVVVRPLIELTGASEQDIGTPQQTGHSVSVPLTGQYQGYFRNDIYDNNGNFVRTTISEPDTDKYGLKDIARLASTALSMGAAAPGGLASNIGSAAANTLGLNLTAAQTAALGSAIGSGGITALQGGNLTDVAKSAAIATIPSVIGSKINTAVGNILPEKITNIQSIDDAITKGISDLGTAAVRAGFTGGDIDLAQTLLPAVAQGIADEYKLPFGQVQTGLKIASKVLNGQDLSMTDFANIAKTFGVAPAKGMAASAGYGGVETEGLFDSEEAQAIEDDIASVLARYPSDGSNIIDDFLTSTGPYETSLNDLVGLAQDDTQRYEVASERDPSIIPDWDVIPPYTDATQTVDVTGTKPTYLPISEVNDEIYSLEGRFPPPAETPKPTPAPTPAGQTVVTTGTKLDGASDEDVVPPPPSPTPAPTPEPTQKIEVVGTKLTPPPPAPTPEPPPASAPTPAPTPAPGPSPATPAPPKQPDLRGLMQLLAFFAAQQQQQKQERNAADIRAESPFGSIFDEEGNYYG